MLSVAIEATPAAIQQAGVGRYCRELLRALVQECVGDRFRLVAAAESEAVRRLLTELPPGAWREVARLPASNRVMTALWQRLRVPLTVERLGGQFDLFHGTDFVLPPTKRPTVVTVHDLSYLHYPEYAHPDLVAYLRAAVPRALQRADGVITVSASVAAEVAAAYPFARDRIVAIPNGVRFPDTSVPRRAECDRPVVLMVGTVEPRKGHLTLLDAMSVVWDAHPDTRLAVVGRAGWMADGIAKRLSEVEATGRLTWYQHCTDDQLENLYAAATVFAYPSWYEGFGLPVLEAMARGVPVVASDIPAIRETAGDRARLVPPGNVEALACALIELIDHEEQRRQLGASGIDQARRRTWLDCARRTRRVYQAVGGRG